MEINSIELKEKISKGDKIIFVVFAEACGACRIQKPIFEKVSQKAIEENSEVSYYILDVYSDRSFSDSLGIRILPTIKLFANGREVATTIGVMNELQLKSLEDILINI